jgi:Spy/CpxP family protein refolding chaperone
MTRTTISAALLWLVLAGDLHAQQHTSDYAQWRGREIKALSEQQLADLREGKGMGLSLPAELNGAPGPLHALEMRAALDISEAQAAELARIIAQMKANAQRLGPEVIRAERELDTAFRSGQVDEQNIDELTRRAALLNGQLRAEHLKAHLQTRRLLSPAQIAAYDRARGYAGTSAQGHAPDPKHGHH